MFCAQCNRYVPLIHLKRFRLCALKSRWSSILRLFYILSAGLEAVMRSMKKSKERDTESKNQPVVASVSKLICTTRGQSSTLNGESINLHSTLGARDFMVTRFLSRPPHLWLKRSAEDVSAWCRPQKILPHAGTQGNKLQSWTKVLGTVMQYLYFFVILGSVVKQCILFEIFLQFSLPPTLYKVEPRKNFLDTRVQRCLRGKGRGWARVNWKTPRNAKGSRRFDCSSCCS